MKVITRKRWLNDESYVEVRYQPKWTEDGFGKLDVYYFVRDPRKAQYYKAKYRSRASSHGVVEPNFDVDVIALSNNIFAGSAYSRKQSLAAREIFKELRLTSSVSRALAS